MFWLNSYIIYIYMKILNNFDTQLKKNEFREAIKQFWKNNVILVERYIFFWILKWVLPFFIATCFLIGTFFLSYYLLYTYKTWFFISIWVMLTLYIFPLWKLTATLIEYKLDFSVVTPDEIITHKQTWIFISKFKNLPTKKIRSLSSARSGILWNIFSFWYIEFMTDWSAEASSDGFSHWAWKIRFTCVHNPNEIRKKIVNLCLKIEENENSKIISLKN